jgi:hypothetical protein
MHKQPKNSGLHILSNKKFQHFASPLSCIRIRKYVKTLTHMPDMNSKAGGMDRFSGNPWFQCDTGLFSFYSITIPGRFIPAQFPIY